MSTIAERFEGVLEPYIGVAVTRMVLRAAASGIGREVDELGVADLPEFEDQLRRLLEPVMSANAVDTALAEADRRSSL